MHEAERVRDAVAQIGDELAQTLAAAIRIPSINPAYPGVDRESVFGGEGEMARFMANIYGDLSCETTIFHVEEGRDNAIGRFRGRGDGRSLILNGHHDVVPVGDSSLWTEADPFEGKIDPDRVWGRGASDMKGGIIAQTYALKALQLAGIRLRGDLILESVSAEETGQYRLGTGAAIERGVRADAAIVAEPSGPATLAVGPCSTGLLVFRLQVTGRATHAGMRGSTIYPGGDGYALGVSAIDKGLLMMDGISRLENQWSRRKRHPFFPPGHFTIMPGVIEGAPVGVRIPYYVPDSFAVEYVVWYPPNEEPEAIKREIEDFVGAVAQTDDWLTARPPVITWIKDTPGASLEASHPLCRELLQAHLLAAQDKPEYLTEPRIQGFLAAEETIRFQQAGIPAINYGPGDIRLAHAANEYVMRDELVTACATYAIFAMRWCGFDSMKTTI